MTGFNLVGFLSGTGPMWFAVALFGFSLIYGLVRLISRRSAPASGRKQLEPTLGMAVSLILIIAVFAFLIRIVQPIGTDILNFQLCYFASYIVLFIVGIIAYRNNLFAKISYRAGKRCGNRRHRFGLPRLVCLGGNSHCDRNHRCH